MRSIERTRTGTEKFALAHIEQLFRQGKYETVNRVQPGLGSETPIEDFASFAANNDCGQQCRGFAQRAVRNKPRSGRAKAAKLMRHTLGQLQYNIIIL